MAAVVSENNLMEETPVVLKAVDWCKSASKVVQYSCTWDATSKSKDFSRRGSGSTNIINFVRSPTFKFNLENKLAEYEAYIVLHISRQPALEEEAKLNRGVSLYLKFVTSFDESIIAKLKFHLRMPGHSTQTAEMEVNAANYSYSKGWGFDTFAIWNITNFLEGTWTVFCTFSLVTETRSMSYLIPKQSRTKKVLEGFERLCLSDLFSDLTLEVGKEHLKAHKAILATQSPVFAAMLTSDMKEAKSNVINIEDLDVEVVKEMLSYMYTGSVKDLDGMASELLDAADKYGLDHLKLMCEGLMTNTLSIENASQILRLSDLHQADQLKVKSVEFIKKNMTAVKKTEGWGLLKTSCPNLIIELFLY